MVRLCVAPERLLGPQVALEDDEVGYLVRVRRLRPGASVEVFDGAGMRRTATLGADGRSLVLGPGEKAVVAARFQYELWQALPKTTKIEWILQKATELGVSRVVPMVTERVVVQLPSSRAESRLARWRRVVEEAARQSGRSEVPEIGAPRAFADLLATRDAGVSLALAYEHERELALTAFLNDVPAGRRVVLLIGPEGGFAIGEVERALEAGAIRVGLGPFILRTETAALVACALAQQAAWGLG